MRVTICSYFCLALAWAQYFDPQISNRQSSPALGDYRVQNNNNQISTSVAQNSAIPVFVNNDVPGTSTAIGTGSLSFGTGGSVINQDASFTPSGTPTFINNNVPGTNNGIINGPITGGNVSPVVNQGASFTPFVPSPGIPVFTNNNNFGTNNGVNTGSTLGNVNPVIGTSFGNASPVVNQGTPSIVQTAPPIAFSPVQTSPPVASPPIIQPAAPPSPPVTSPPVPPAPAAPPNANQGTTAPLSCHIRQCDQTITGRGLSYSRALEIMQDEEYLTEADLSVIRIKRLGILKRQKRQQYEQGLLNLNLAGLPVICILVIIAVLKFVILIVTTPTRGDDFDPTPPGPTGPTGPTGPQIGPGLTPVTLPLPGQNGGGQLPIGTSLVVLEALSLVPDGLQAVSVFPPFIRPRTYDAVGVIFREQSSNFQRRFGSRRRLSIVQRMKQAWSRYFGSNRRDSVGQGYHGHGGPSGSGGQIFEEDLFGFRIRVTLVNETCTLGLTCDANGNKINNFRITHRIDDFYDRQTGQEFSSNAPPDCRTILNPDGCV